MEALLEADFDAVVTDLNMPGANGIDLCERISTNRPDVPVVVITAFGSFDTAVAAIRAGAYDFITKPFDLDALRLTLDRAVQHRRLRDEVKRLEQEVTRFQGFGELLGESQAIKRVLDLVQRAAESEATVLITGESGTGKELVARALHAHSRRATGPFVAVNCGAMPETLLESELFGHARGALTDAKAARSGLLLNATGGTLFLDEIGDAPLGFQQKLLRALEDRKVRPLGENAECAFDARFGICNESGFGSRGGARAFPRRSLLQDQRGSRRCSAASGARERHPYARTAFLAALQWHIGQGRRRAVVGGSAKAARVFVARQCARATQLYGARGCAHALPGDRR